MFSRISYDEFQLLFPVIGFFLFAVVFLGAVIKVALMKKTSINHLSAMPLEDEAPGEILSRRNGRRVHAPGNRDSHSASTEPLTAKS
jgi:hypothetical protein